MGGITRRTLLETQDIKESAVTGGKILDHTLGSQELGTSAAIIVEGTQIKEDLITEHHVLDHTLGSHNLGTTVAIIVEGTQIKADVIGSVHVLDHSLGSQHLGTTVAIIVEGTQIKADVIGSVHVLDHSLGSQHLGTTVAIIVEGTQIKNAIVTAAKFYELQEHGTVADVTKTGTHLTFDTAFGGTPDLVISPETGVGPGTFPYIFKKRSGSALLKLTAPGTVVCDYIAWGPR